MGVINVRRVVILLSDLSNFLKLLRNTIREPRFICINVYVSHKMGLASCFLSLSNINDVYSNINDTRVMHRSIDDYKRFRGMEVSHKTHWRTRGELSLFLLS